MESKIVWHSLKKKDTRHCLTMEMATFHPEGFYCLGYILIFSKGRLTELCHAEDL